MAEHSFKLEFGNSWRRYSRILRETAPEIIETFKGSLLEKNMSEFYGWAVPRKWESPINFFLRNSKLSYKPCSERQKGEFIASAVLLKLGWYIEKIPFLRMIINLDRFSTELFIGQDSSSYVSEKRVRAEGYGETTVNAARPMDLDFDVGFGSGRNYFCTINTHDSSLLPPAEKAYKILEIKKLRMEEK